MTLAEASVRYAGQGWRVFPCQDKRPLVTRGFHDATCDLEQIAQWWRSWPDAQVGAPVPRAFAVVDVDPRHGGKATLAALAT